MHLALASLLSVSAIGCATYGAISTTGTNNAPVAASAAGSAKDAMPSLDDTCAGDSDCTLTGLYGTCCANCAEKYANKAYVARAQAYCGRNPPAQCPPMACSWLSTPPKCIERRCRVPQR